MYEEAYKKLIVWKNLCELRREIFLSTEKFQHGNYRLVEQMRAAARSAKQNFCEGYKKGSIGQFINFCNISRASLEELNEDIEDCFEDKLIEEISYNKLHVLSVRTMFLLDKYIKSLFILKQNGKWNSGKY
jgi:four helix bundle protein